MKQGAESKLKFKKLQRRLGLSRWQCTGLLETLWQVTCQNAWLGDIGKLSNEDIAAVMEWEGNSDELVMALLETGWIDHSDEHRLDIKANAAKHGHELCKASPRERQREPPRDTPRDEKTPPNSLPPSQVKSSQANSSQAKTSLSPSATDEKETALVERETRFVASWNALEGVLPNSRPTLSKKRRVMFRARLKEPGWAEDCAAAFKKFPLKMFHEKNGWQPTIEFMLRPDVAMSILEGKYDRPLDGESPPEPLDIAGALERTRKDGDDG